jgi:hypothetical protein
MAAAWATFFAYGVMLVLVWAIALRVYVFPYEYKRLALIAIAAIGIFMLGTKLQFDWIAIDLIIKGLLWLLFPFILAVLRFFTPAEEETLLSFIQQVLAGLRRATLKV